MAVPERYAFAEFMLDVTERRLSRDGHPISLEPKTHDVLVVLLRRAGRLVTKRELLDLVWPESFVEDGILTVHVSTLRKALRTGAHREYIETIPRSGYRFVGAVTKQKPEGEEAPERRAHNGQGKARPATGPSRGHEAYELFGRGRSHLLAASALEVPKAVAAFRAAIECDPTYAAAHAGLALACCAQAELRAAPLAESFNEARAAALRALAMNDACADAQVALGAVLYLSDWNWIGAERSLERALELNPNHTEAYLLYGRLLETLGQLDRGLEVKERALERDPFSALVHLQISLSYWNQHRYEAAIEWASKALALDPRHPHAREHLAAAYLKTGEMDRWMAENIRHAELHGAPPQALDPLKKAYAEGGRPGVVEFVLEHAGKLENASAIMLAVHYGEAGQLDAAFGQLQRALDSRDPALVHLAVAPQWDPLRTDPRFDQCLARMGLSRTPPRTEKVRLKPDTTEDRKGPAEAGHHRGPKRSG